MFFSLLYICNKLLKIKKKFTIKENTITYCCNRSKNKKSKILELQNQLNSLTEKLDSSYTDETLTEKTEVETQLNNIWESETMGAFIRSKADCIENGDKCIKFF